MIQRLRALNKGVALMVGFGLLACAAFVLTDIIMRRFGTSLGGTEEIAGYAMALATSWGMSYTLLELGHVRIDILRTRFQTFGKAVFDVFSICVLTGVVITIAIKSWPVVERSLVNGSRANTPLETPLIWVQAPWFAGWVWFAIMSTLLSIAALSLLVKRRFDDKDSIISAFAEQDTLQ